ncbi:MAG TPA: hypothetical protein VN276_06695 [Bacteroidales bacterium]|nr:hypothetical protein [Bacteroidales bacterium]
MKLKKDGKENLTTAAGRPKKRDGFMSVDGNSGPAENYYPNSFDSIEADKNFRETAMALESNMADKELALLVAKGMCVKYPAK